MKAAFLMAVVCCAAAALAAAETGAPASLIQTVELNAARPYFVPTHPRVTTTIRFPGEIGAPEGAVSVFVEDAAKESGEYLVSWQPGDSYFAITPLKDPKMANLNVPYQGQTFVVYFYPVTDPLGAVASINLSAPGTDMGASNAPQRNQMPPAGSAQITRQSIAPTSETVAVTPGRLVGFLDRLKLLHATPDGPALAELAKTMGVQIAVTREEHAAGADAESQSNPDIAHIGSGTNDAGLYQIVLLRAVRDRRINCVGFVCLLRNTSDQTLTFDVSSFGARAGLEYLPQRISDASPILQPGEQAPAYFIVSPPHGAPLRAANAWKLSVDLVSPRTNPGAGIARGFEAPSSSP